VFNSTAPKVVAGSVDEAASDALPVAVTLDIVVDDTLV
jgi:hypothetical protein